MSFAKGGPSIGIEDLLEITTEANIASYYLGIKSIPSIIKSPLRQDNHPSFGIYSPNGIEVNYIDFASREGGRIYTLLSKLWNISIEEVIVKVYNEFQKQAITPIKITVTNSESKISHHIAKLECKIREWKNYDIEYWKSYGITLPWLKYADVYPISHKIITKDGKKSIFGADKYAYVYVERKENKITLKVYQPFNKYGFKWCNTHDKSVISLWTKIPDKGDKLCICSSLKDALCLWINTKIPALAIQGEGYKISKTAIDNLKSRYKNIYIILDNDAPGLKDAETLSKETGFTNLILPQFEGGKDISDLYKIKGKNFFISTLSKLFNYEIR